MALYFKRLWLICSHITFCFQPGSSNLSLVAKNAAAEIERRLELGSTLSDVIQRREDAAALLDLYRNEGYLLTEHNGKFCVSNSLHDLSFAVLVPAPAYPSDWCSGYILVLLGLDS